MSLTRAPFLPDRSLVTTMIFSCSPISSVLAFSAVLCSHSIMDKLGWLCHKKRGQRRKIFCVFVASQELCDCRSSMFVLGMKVIRSECWSRFGLYMDQFEMYLDCASDTKVLTFRSRYVVILKCRRLEVQDSSKHVLMPSGGGDIVLRTLHINLF
jgi:hypothetical protein